MRGTTVVYAALCCSLIAIGGLILLVPLLTMTLEELQRDFDVDFQEVKGMTDTMWQDLMLLRKGIPLNVERKIRQAGYGDTTKPHSYGKPPSYGYGYTKLKCCCAIEGAVGPSLYQSSQPAYPTSYKCPAGYHGPPGPPGESGMPGSAGQPGSPGEDYPTTNNNIGVTQGYQSITPTQGVGPGGLGYGGGDFRGGDGGVFGYGDYRPAQPSSICEPCPPGPPGHYGPKGKPGSHGKKGAPGAPGLHGKPGHAGRPGYPGEVGHKGLPGVVGPQGRNGADGQRGGKGPRGAKGEPGGKGVYGAAGAPGQNGSPGPFGPPGKPGPRGLKGHDGPQGSAGAQGIPGSPGKDANYCPCPNREDSSYGKSPSTNPTSYGVGEGGNIATYNNINAGGSRGDSGANGFNSLSPYNRYTGSTFSPTGTRSTFLTYPPADPTPSTQLYSQPKDTIFGPGAPSGNPFNGGSSSSRESFPSAAFENEEQPRFAPQSGRVSNTVAAGAKSNRAFVPLDSLSTSSSPSSSSSPKGEANIPASIFSDKAIHPAFPQKLPIIKPLSTSGPLYRVRTVDTTSKSAFGWQRTTPFITNARLHDDERIFSRYHPKQQA